MLTADNIRLQRNHKEKLSSCYDVIVIGAGVVGCAMARQFTLEGASVLVIEKATDILEGASKGNSAILHTGFDAPPDSVEHSCIVDSYQAFLSIRKKLKLPLLKTGALVVAWTGQEEAQLEGILQKAFINGVDDACLIGAQEILRKEPQLSSAVKAAVHIPGEYVIDPWTTPYVLMLQAIRNGATLRCSTEVTGGEFDGEAWTISIDKGNFTGTTVINCAGLYGDKLDRMLIKQPAFEIRPRKGQFIVYDKAASHLLSSIILPVPSETTKGIVVCRTIFGNVLVGPTADEQQSREDTSVDKETLEALQQKGREIIPALADQPITATYAGIRPATQYKDYCIKYYRETRYISVGGIRSTGLTSALGIAKRVFGEYQQAGHKCEPRPEVGMPELSPIAETETRDWQLEGNDGIVCHCELVTRREIKQALGGEMPATSLSGLKRRTRVTMGRCQGFYCSEQLSELTRGHFEIPMTKEAENE